MEKVLRVVHYINQFYGGYGGEDTADMGIVVKQEAIGPGKAFEATLKGKGHIVATVICGDNYVTENIETAVPEILEIIKGFNPDVVVAGPGFNAGRYGLACGAITTGVTEILKVPAVTSLYIENPGTELYKDRCYILVSQAHGKYMRKAVMELGEFVLKIGNGLPIGTAEEDGYHPNGPAPVIDYTIPVAKRALAMLLNKYNGLPFITEVRIPKVEQIDLPVMTKELKDAKIALVTDGGLVPKGNPDHLPVVDSKTFKHYDITAKTYLKAEDYEVCHQGYNNAFVNEDPNRLVPVDALRAAVKDGKIGSMLNEYYTTAGVRTSLENAKKFGTQIAKELLAKEVDGVLLTST